MDYRCVACGSADHGFGSPERGCRGCGPVWCSSPWSGGGGAYGQTGRALVDAGCGGGVCPAFALSHPLALIVGTWPAAFLAAMVSGAAAYELTPPR